MFSEVFSGASRIAAERRGPLIGMTLLANVSVVAAAVAMVTVLDVGLGASEETPSAVVAMLELTFFAVGFGLVLSAMTTASVAVALGESFGAALARGFRSLPKLVTQLTIAGWPLLVGALVIDVVLYFLPGLVPVTMLVQLGLYVLFGGRCLAVMGSVASGNEDWRPDAALERLGGGFAVPGTLAVAAATLITLVVSLIPIVALFVARFIPSAIASFWEQVDGSGGTAPLTRMPAPTQAGAVAPHVVGAAPASYDPRGPIAVAPAPAAPVVGPAWEGVLLPGTPWGSWVSLQGPGVVHVQLSWSEGPPPSIQLADASGQWTAPPQQPSVNGQAVGVTFPAGDTYLGIGLRGATPQSVRIATWLPPAAAGIAA
ncbi:MAG: hypothetical protein JWM86_2910 [Thermoleophilia bacterium]|nr:hypothetical protein [Thermoleophilia bacterium]